MVARVGRLVATGEHGEPYRLVDASDAVVEPAAVFLRELLAAGRSAATLRSYGMDLLRWWRFLHAVDVGWDRATRVEARDFSCWIQLTVKQRRLAARQDRADGRLRAGDRRAQRDGGAWLLRLSSGCGHRPDPEPVSARSVPSVGARARTP